MLSSGSDYGNGEPVNIDTGLIYVCLNDALPATRYRVYPALVGLFKQRFLRKI